MFDSFCYRSCCCFDLVDAVVVVAISFQMVPAADDIRQLKKYETKKNTSNSNFVVLCGSDIKFQIKGEMSDKRTKLGFEL